MATLQARNGSFRVLFVYHGKRETFTLGKIPQDIAEAKAAKVDEVLALLKSGYIQLPDGMPITTFVQFEGKPPADEGIAVQHDVHFLKTLRDRYLAVHEGSLEKTTIDGIKLHFKHLLATLGERFPIAELSLESLQQHADRRKVMKGIKGKVSSATIRKELISLRTAWNWAVSNDWVQGRFPALRKVKMPKPDEKPPFQTWHEIERRVGLGGLTQRQIDELWDALYLRKEEVAELLEHVRQTANLPWIYPFFCTAAHTGTRRSELIRMQVADVDFGGDTLLIREKKRAHDKTTTRRVSLTPFLKQVLQDWLAVHPGGPSLFCQSSEIFRSKKRSRNTGYKDEKTREKTVKGRLATVRQRELPPPGSLTRDEAHDHFKRVLATSKWKVLKGAHVLRHSFISCLAAAGVDQRIIDDFVGHQTDEQRRRYRHLLPNVKQQAIQTAFDA